MSGARVAVVVPALDEEASIAAVVAGFRARPEVAQVIVVDNASRDRTAERARAAGAVVVREDRPGYGAALRAGIEHALGSGCDIVVLSEADGTFEPGEIGSLLAPLDRHGLVLGSRTHALRGALRHGNRAVARVLAALWPRSACPLTDVGCTYRALTAASPTGTTRPSHHARLSIVMPTLRSARARREARRTAPSPCRASRRTPPPARMPA
jgi:glycosyltransferase involved in cell wall biosynthesis